MNLLKKTLHLDRFGIAVSALCLVHCLAVPILASLLPLLQLSGSLTDSTLFHLLLVFVVVPVGVRAFASGWKIHKHRTVVVFGGSGLLLVSLGSLLPLALHDENAHEYGHWSYWLELALLIPGSLFLTAAHLRNYQCRLLHSKDLHPHH